MKEKGYGTARRAGSLLTVRWKLSTHTCGRGTYDCATVSCRPQRNSERFTTRQSRDITDRGKSQSHDIVYRGKSQSCDIVDKAKSQSCSIVDKNHGCKPCRTHPGCMKASFIAINSVILILLGL